MTLRRRGFLEEDFACSDQALALTSILAGEPRAPSAPNKHPGERASATGDVRLWGGHPAARTQPGTVADQGATQDPRGSAGLGDVEGMVPGLGI